FIYHYLNQGDVDDAYLVQVIWEYQSKLDIDVLKQAWKLAQRKYPSLRLRFSWDEELLQIIDKEGVVDFRYVDLSAITDATVQEGQIKQIQEADRLERYKLEEGNLFRLHIIKQRDELYTCIFSSHHAILDGWSNPILLNFVHNAYTKLSKGEELSYIDTVEDQSYKGAQKYLQDYREENSKYWQDYINKIEEKDDLSILITSNKKGLRLNNYKQVEDHKAATLSIKDSLYDKLKTLSKEEGITLNAILQYVWHKVLKVYGSSNSNSSNNQTITTVVGTTVSGRNIPVSNIEHSVGLYINTLPLIVEHNTSEDTTTTIVDAIKKLQSDVTEINTRSNTSLAKLQKDGTRLFDTLFVFENYPVPTENKETNEEGTKQSLSIYFKQAIERLDYPLSVIAYEGNNSLTFSINYAGELFTEETIKQLLSTAKTILTQIGEVENSLSKDTKEQTLTYLSTQEQHKLLINYNNTQAPFPHNKTIQQLFEEQAERTPDNVAIIYNNIRLTYKELNERANRLASYLITNHSITPDTLIPLLLDRSEHMIISILAVLKAGGAYVPMDPDYPDERINYILEDTGSRIIITNKKYEERLQEIIQTDTDQQKISIVSVDDANSASNLPHLLSKDQTANPAIKDLSSTNLAYVIYTSGTTGKPKGVMIEHRGVVSLVKEVDYIKVNNQDTSIQLADTAFDAAIFEIWISLLNGGKLFIPHNTMVLFTDTGLFKEVLVKEDISILWLTKTLFDQLFLIDTTLFKDIKYLLVGGEALNKKLIKTLRDSDDAPQNILNGYGPTENTTFSCTFNISKDNIEHISSVPIGHPISNTTAYVLSASSTASDSAHSTSSTLTPLPTYAIGELYIGGVGLARGYLNNEELTKERFIPNPFQTEEEKADTEVYGPLGRNARLYKTGDLVRWLPCGNLEYIGRSDFQVKIRGFRIELGEIESVLSTYPNIKQCVVVAREHEGNLGTNKYLAAYYTTTSGEAIKSDTLISHLSSSLPDYMIPTAFVWLDALPLTVNGKLDRKALPSPELGSDSSSYVAPRSELESKLCLIFAEVLGLDLGSVGIRDDFFKMGGDSIVSIQVVSRIRQRVDLGNNVCSVKDIFTYRTIEKLYDNVVSKHLESNTTNSSSITSEQGMLSGEVTLLPIQEWFFENDFTTPSHFNQSFLVKVASTLDIDILQKAVDVLVNYHDAFRLRYDGDRQYYDDKAAALPIQTLDVSTLSEAELHEVLTLWQSSFDLTTGPLYSIGYIHGFSDKSSRIFFALHHLIVDAVSWRILTEDLRDLYSKAADPSSFGPKGTSYRQWVEAIRSYASINKEESSYWDNVTSDISGSNKILESIFTSTSVDSSSASTSYSSLSLTKTLTNKLLKESNKAYNTEINDLLLSALGLALNEVLGSLVNHITLEGHGREEEIGKQSSLHLDLSRTIGWFTTMYPVRLEVGRDVDNGTVDLASTIKYTKELLRQVPNKGIGFGSIIGYQDHLLPKVSFNYLGQLDQTAQSNNNANTWSITEEASGIQVSPNNHDRNIININGAITQNVLSFSIASKLNNDITSKLAEVLKDKLEEVVNHSSSLQRTYLTVSDVGNITTQEYLDKLQEQKEVEAVYLANSLQQGF
ncbi:MAG: amino acid adenylation domain-containing protein, partial [Candidatus Riesia sp.]|nr:amino acid adenylation domain-containing protein [Candidatus Riesia sp.]